MYLRKAGPNTQRYKKKKEKQILCLVEEISYILPSKNKKEWEQGDDNLSLKKKKRLTKKGDDNLPLKKKD